MMTCPVCAVRSEQLLRDAVAIRAWLRVSFTRPLASEIVARPPDERLTAGQTWQLERRWSGMVLTEFGHVWNDREIMAPPPIYYTLRGGWEPS